MMSYWIYLYTCDGNGRVWINFSFHYRKWRWGFLQRFEIKRQDKNTQGSRLVEQNPRSSVRGGWLGCIRLTTVKFSCNGSHSPTGPSCCRVAQTRGSCINIGLCEKIKRSVGIECLVNVCRKNFDCVLYTHRFAKTGILGDPLKLRQKSSYCAEGIISDALIGIRG